ncbi:MAG: hypothetical protein GF317_13190 [Candidatus Lokiarchaeota archaeon]|nr:hypothetical protein [Candidatus Lokiarchaeota archaeon]MBD3200591.1 hypothetical protein [Candidatus Lokiarchaeota archaeon]
MTGQIHDTCVLNNETYEIVRIKGDNLPKPENYGLNPRMASTACRRGYVMHYSLLDSQIYLDSIDIRTDNPKPIQENSPLENEGLGFNYKYQKLHIPIEFTGEISLGTDLISYVHMGFQEPSQYKKLLKLIVSEGKIKNIIDLSREMEMYRNHRSTMKDENSPPFFEDKNKLRRWIQERFKIKSD